MVEAEPDLDVGNEVLLLRENPHRLDRVMIKSSHAVETIEQRNRRIFQMAVFR